MFFTCICYKHGKQPHHIEGSRPHAVQYHPNQNRHYDEPTKPHPRVIHSMNDPSR